MNWFIKTGYAFVVLGCLSASPLATGSASAETPLLSFSSAEGHEGFTGFDVLNTNQTYAMARCIWVSARIANPTSGPPVQVDDLAISCAIPPSLGYLAGDIDYPLYLNWNADAGELVLRTAAPMTNENQFWTTANLISSNAFMNPKVQAQRFASQTLMAAGQVLTQTFVMSVYVPPNALAGCNFMSIDVDAYNIGPSGIEAGTVSTGSIPGGFFTNSSRNLPAYVCQNASALSGLYSFTNVLWLSNGNASAMNFMPGLQLVYAQEQTPWDTRGYGTAWGHVYNNNGILVRASTTEDVNWEDQQTTDRTSWRMAPKWAVPGNDQPGLEHIELVRASRIGVDGKPSLGFTFNGDGSNIVAATLLAPDGTVYIPAVDWGESCYLEIATQDSGDLAKFTGGTYTVRLYDFTNGLRQTYSALLMGNAVTETPTVVVPNYVSTSNQRPDFAWQAPTDPNCNAQVLAIDTHITDEIFQLWPETSTTNYVVDQDLFASVEYELLFVQGIQLPNNGATVTSGYASGRRGILNVVTNGENLAFARGVTIEPRIFQGSELNMLFFDFGFMPGANCTYMVDFGDGATTNATAAAHRYASAGTYTQLYVVVDNTGFAVTGTTTRVVYAPPKMLGIWMTNGPAVAMGFPTITGALYNVAYSGDLTNWNGNLISLVGTGATNVVQDALDGSGRRFYRLECELNP